MPIPPVVRAAPIPYTRRNSSCGMHACRIANSFAMPSPDTTRSPAVLGLGRRIVLSLPQFLIAPFVAAKTDPIAAIASRITPMARRGRAGHCRA